MLNEEQFSQAETDLLKKHFTNTDRPVFALKNLPEVVKGALFARYSRSPKSVRQLFLDEFKQQVEQGSTGIVAESATSDTTEHAEGLYNRIFLQYGDDSVAQLGGAHIACENVSNVMSKLLERSRLGAYLEQSTRYIFYDTKVNGHYRYVTPPEIERSPLAAEYKTTMDQLFDAYSLLVRECLDELKQTYKRDAAQSNTAWNASLRAKACDIARGVLPAATACNVGVFATGQTYEKMLLKLRSEQLEEARSNADAMLGELRQIIPAFLTRVDIEDRGIAWSNYFKQTKDATARQLTQIEIDDSVNPDEQEVELAEWDNDGEIKVAAAIIYEHKQVAYADAYETAAKMDTTERGRLIEAYAGQRLNRRHMPGRAFESTYYRFNILADYGSFRDLQRHRMLTIEWQKLTPRYGYVTPPELTKQEHLDLWERSMQSAAALYDKLNDQLGPDCAQYAVPFAYKIRYTMLMNAREACHLIELRTSPQGHDNYRRICADMYNQIENKANHRAIAAIMKFVNRDLDIGLNRLESERRTRSRSAQLNLLSNAA